MRSLVFCLLFLAAAATLHAITPLPASASALGPREIVNRAVEQDQQLQARRKQFDYDLVITRQKLSSKQEPLSTTQSNVKVASDARPDYGTRRNVAVEREVDKASREEPFNLLKIVNDFTYSLKGVEKVNGIDCYKIAFTPKPNLPYRNREEKVVHEVAGHLWISQKDYSLLQNEGTLQRPVAVGWIFATLRELEFRYESQPLPNGDFGPKRVSYRFLVSIPFGKIHERHTRSISNYRLINRS